MQLFQNLKFKKGVEAITGAGTLRRDVSMAEYTSFKCGGTVNWFIEPKSRQQLSSLVKYLRSIDKKYMILGNGSNTLFSDGPHDIVVIHLGDVFARMGVKGRSLTAGCGALLSTVAREAARNSLTGLEFACGIPGSIGGAVYMNAGAYGKEMADVIDYVTLMDTNGNIQQRFGEELGLNYRKSSMQSNGMILLDATFKLEKKSQTLIFDQMKEYNTKRAEKQPLQYPSAGSFFRRPTGYFAGKLIQDCGLKGLQLGGAQVSDMHAGFIINTGNATATDIINLMHVIQETVYNKEKVRLFPEVRIIE